MEQACGSTVTNDCVWWGSECDAGAMPMLHHHVNCSHCVQVLLHIHRLIACIMWCIACGRACLLYNSCLSWGMCVDTLVITWWL
jgi:hypothetical protein